MKHACLYPDLFQAVNGEPLIGLGACQRGHLFLRPQHPAAEPSKGNKVVGNPVVWFRRSGHVIPFCCPEYVHREPGSFRKWIGKEGSVHLLLVDFTAKQAVIRLDSPLEYTGSSMKLPRTEFFGVSYTSHCLLLVCRE